MRQLRTLAVAALSLLVMAAVAIIGFTPASAATKTCFRWQDGIFEEYPCGEVTPPLENPPPPPPVTTPPVPGTAPAPNQTHEVPTEAARMLQLVNNERHARGLGMLVSRADVAGIATQHSWRMANEGRIFHSTSFISSTTRSLLGALALGENVAFNVTIDVAHTRLMASPSHRSNLLDASFDTVGIGVVRQAGGTYYITQNFIRAGGTRSVPAAAPTTSPA